MKKVFILIGLFICIMLFSSCENKMVVINGFSMDAPYSVKMTQKNKDDKNKEKKVRELLKKADFLFDAYDENSSLGRLNKNKEIYISDENRPLYDIVEKTYPYCNDYFDISIRNVSKLWDFNSDNPEVPKKEDIEEALMTVGYENIILKDEKIELKNNSSIELGAVAKGYIADEVFSLLKDNEAVIDIGGTVISSVPKKIKTGIKNPDGDGILCTFYLDFGEAVSTSGSYERYFIKDGIKYSHILDLKTGYGISDEILCVTVIAPNALMADILSTSYFSLGLKGMEVVEEDVGAIFVTKDKKVYIKGNIEISDLNKDYKLQ